MMGTKTRRFAPLPPVSLEDLVPSDHFYRHLERVLDLAFVRELVRAAYAEIGRPSIDPVVFFKLQLVLFFEGLRSERQLMRVVADRFSLRWYLGYDLTESLPDHSSLSRIRERYGLAVFRRFFETIVEQCISAGLVWGHELYVDATKVAANADLDSLVPRFYHDAKTHLAGLFADEVAKTEGDDDFLDPATDLQPEITRLPHEPADSPLPASHPPWKLLEERRLDPHRPAVGTYRRTTDFRVSVTDPDAAPMRTGSGTALGYHDHYVVDGGKGRIILAALVTPADVMENVPLRDLLWRVCFRRKLRPSQVTGDTTYGTTENIVALEDASIRAFFPLPDFDQRTPFFGKSAFTYDAAADAYRCPQG